MRTKMAITWAILSLGLIFCSTRAAEGATQGMTPTTTLTTNPPTMTTTTPKPDNPTTAAPTTAAAPVTTGVVTRLLTAEGATQGATQGATAITIQNPNKMTPTTTLTTNPPTMTTTTPKPDNPTTAAPTTAAAPVTTGVVTAPTATSKHVMPTDNTVVPGGKATAAPPTEVLPGPATAGTGSSAPPTTPAGSGMTVKATPSAGGTSSQNSATTSRPVEPTDRHTQPAVVISGSASAVTTGTKGQTQTKTTEGSAAQRPTTTPRSGVSPIVTGQSTATNAATKATTTPTTPTTTAPTTTSPPTLFIYNNGDKQPKGDEEHYFKLCTTLTKGMKLATCKLFGQNSNGKHRFSSVEISGKVDPDDADKLYAEITQKPNNNTTLIAILASCGALLTIIVGFALYASYHRKSYRKNQQHLTEELQTVENGYHDNPTLEVMEVQPEMQEKKVPLNGECNDSWIVPIDNLVKEVADEEDTHL